MKNQEMKELSFAEMTAVYGGTAGDGSLAYDLAWLGARTMRSIWEFSKMAAEYQASLPANLKK